MAKVRLSLESLSSRTLPSATLLNGILTVNGTEAKDAIVVVQTGDRLSVRGQTIDDNGTQVKFVPAATVTRVDVIAHGGNDIVRLGSLRMPSTVDAGDGNDSLTGGRNDDTLNGGAGNDRITGNGGNDDLVGESGDDRLTGNVGDDSIDGNAGDDSMFGGNGNDLMFGGSGDDRGSGNSGDDTIFGDDGNDTLSGGSDDDLLLGEEGDDRLDGNSGSDDCQGGVGDDNVRNDDHGGSATSTSVEGTITAIDLVASKVTIQTPGGTTVEVIVTASTIVQRNDAHTTLNTFVVGDPCEAKFDALGNTLKIEAGLEDNRQDRVEGTITAIDLANSTVTVRTQSGQLVIITVRPSTEIERNDESTTLATFQVGDICEARLDTLGATLKIEAVGM